MPVDLASSRRARNQRRARGFTLTELMVVVALVAILAIIGVASFRREVSASKTTEASAVIQAIRAAEEEYRSEHQFYLNVTSADEGWYPVNTFGETKYEWRGFYGTHADGAAWRNLNAQVTQPVQFRYMVTAGVPGAVMTVPVSPEKPTWPTPTDAWYVIQARADYDNDSVYCDALASSLNGELFIRHEGE